METPLQIVLRDVDLYKEVLEEEIRKRADKLEVYYPRITSCRVVVERPHKHHHTGNLFRTTIMVNVPEKQIIVSREHPLHHSHEDILVAVHHAFDDAARQIEEFAFVQSGDVKDHDLLPHGVITKLFPEEGYGFIEESGAREIYFHKNSVLDGFDRLKVGTEVRFREEQGEKGPQASTVKILRKLHTHHRGH
ncbi:MAG: HPF/RaiA family ribosome-associated protein [Nitrospiraceae bacterium]|nr:MAG: HPF/RaiA family ribosome-associated protein [Nitrospiraceae bacterium]